MALKLEGFFKKKAQVNLQNAGKINGFETIKRQEPCQNSDNPVENIKENSMIDNPEDEDIEEDLPIPRPKNNYERVEEALKLKDKIPEIQVCTVHT